MRNRLAPFLTLTVLWFWATMVSAQTAPIGAVMIAEIKTDSSDLSISPGKVEAGFALACDLTGLFKLIPSAVRDSFVLALRDSIRFAPSKSLELRDTLFTAAEIARALDATGIAYLFTARIGNLVRSDIMLATGSQYDMKVTGIGYAAIRHADAKKRLADPAILASQQRALAVALRDTALYATADGALNVRPSVPVVVGSVEFIERQGMVPWTLIKEKISASYDAVLVAVEALQSNPRITAVDMETRDSIYALAKMYLVENYNPVSKTELGTLRAFDMRNIVMGRVTRVQGGAELVMTMNWINDDGSYVPLATATRMLTVDSKEMLRDMVSEATKELGDGPIVPTAVGR
ncbi:MAG: hypothetical protein SGJ05_05470 [bacterium]|nr:hypothetical protein [bacterium]